MSYYLYFTDEVHCAHFTDENPKAQKYLVICLKKQFSTSVP